MFACGWRSSAFAFCFVAGRTASRIAKTSTGKLWPVKSAQCPCIDLYQGPLAKRRDSRANSGRRHALCGPEPGQNRALAVPEGGGPLPSAARGNFPAPHSEAHVFTMASRRPL